jgi:RimJ/RimL family protein N-acetyltransferase
MNIEFNKEYILENNVALLRPLAIADFEHLLPFALNEPELWRYSLRSAAGHEAMINYINGADQSRKNKTEYPFIVFDKIQNQYAGCTRFYDIQKDLGNTQLGFTWYGKDFQGTGLNKNCKYLLLEFAFETINAMRVEFRADFLNKKSIAAMKSVGCTEEGVLRSNSYRHDGTRRDSIVLSILRDEWFDHVRTDLQLKLEYKKKAK